MYSIIDKEMKTVLFTSATPGAGKSTVAANTAIVYAQSGKHTLLVDADLRHPTMHYTFETTNQLGLSTAVVNDSTIELIIKEIQIENHNPITSKFDSAEPSESLSLNKMKYLLKMTTAHYDIILIDSPPLLVVTDAQVLSKLADITIMVTDIEANNGAHLSEGKNLRKKAEANIIGVVMNNKKTNTKHDAYYYYYRNDDKQ